MNTQNNQYTVDHFINKFSAIPEDRWITGSFGDAEDGKHCALGHCGVQKDDVNNELGNINHEEGKALALLISIVYKRDNEFSTVYNINDSSYCSPYKQETPKARILAVLQDVKSIQTEQALDASEALINGALSDPDEANDSAIHPEFRIKQQGRIEVSELI